VINVEFVRVEFDKIVQYKQMRMSFRPHKGDVFTWKTDDCNIITTEVYKVEIPIPTSSLDGVYLIAYTE